MSSDEDEVEYELEYFKLRCFNIGVTTISYMPLTKLLALNKASSEVSGQKLWCGSLVVIEYMLDNPQLIIGNTVFELGAGTGVAGMICKILGCNNVYLSDYDKRSLMNMNNDALQNNLDVNVMNLNWFDFNLNEWVQTIEVKGRFHLIAGDVLYKADLLNPFFYVATAILNCIQGSVLTLCHVPRAGVEQIDIERLCIQFNLAFQVVDEIYWKKGVVLEYAPKDDYDRARLYIISSQLT